MRTREAAFGTLARPASARTEFGGLLRFVDFPDNAGRVVVERIEPRQKTACGPFRIPAVEVISAFLYIRAAIANDVEDVDQHPVRHRDCGLLHPMPPRDAEEQSGEEGILAAPRRPRGLNQRPTQILVALVR